MRADEYDFMRRVEDELWWYVGLRALIRQALSPIAIPEEGALLDLGCGTGGHASAMHPGTGICLDYSPHALKYVRERGLNQAVCGDVSHLPFPSEQARCVFAMDVIYHCGVEIEQTMGELARVTQPGGILIINTAAFGWLHGAHDVATGSGRRFTLPELERLLRGAGLEPLYKTYWNTLLLPVVLTVRVLSRYRPGPVRSDLETMPHPLVNAVLSGVLGVERLLLRLSPLPVGSSAFLIARKPAR